MFRALGVVATLFFAFSNSRTLIVNSLTIAASLLAALAGMTDTLPPSWTPFIISALAGVNIALRFMTSGPVSFKPTIL